MIGKFFVVGSIFASIALAAEPVAPPAYHGHFSELPVGAIQPRGWIQHWLERQADGLTGHPENLAYPYNTCLFAGKIPPPVVKHGETWWPYEQSGYLVDATVRLNRLIDSPRIRKIAEENVGYVLDHSGPAKFGESTWGWPNAVVGRALMAEFSATRDERISRIFADFFADAHLGMNRNAYVIEQALFLYGQSGDARLLELAKLGHQRFFLGDPSTFSHADKIRGADPFRIHGVTGAEQLKLLPLLYCYTGDAETLELADLAYRKVEAGSLMPDGGMVSSENLGPVAFNSLHESCDLTDWSWSLGYLLMAGGEAHWADVIEQTTFNALPGAVTKDFKQLQYFSSANQLLASNTACPRISPARMSYRAAHDTECCSGNISRAMPNYVTRMWMKTESGLVATLYGPSEVHTVVAGQSVTIAEETDYPFRATISLRLAIARPATFAIALRIPEWCVAAKIAINGVASGVACKPGTFATLSREYRDGDVLTLQLPMAVRTRDWFGGRAISVQRGPLVFSLQPAEKRLESQVDSEPIRRVLKGNDIAGFPAEEFFPAGEWRYGIDEGVKDAPEKFRVIESPMTGNPFLAETAPVRIEIPLRRLPQWEAMWTPEPGPLPTDLKMGLKNPASLPSDGELQAAAETKTLILVPYGATHLRLTTLPVIGAASR